MTHHTLMYCDISSPLQSYLIMPYHTMSRYAILHCATLYRTVLHYTTVVFVLFIVRFSYFMLLYLVILSINKSARHLGFYHHVTLTSFSPPFPPLRSFLFPPSISSLRFFVSPFLHSSKPLHILPHTQHTTQLKTSSNPTTLHFSSLRHNQCSFLPFYDLK